MSSTLGLFVPGRSVLHRLPAGSKLLGLFFLGLLAALSTAWPRAQLAISLAILATGSLCWILGQLPWRIVRPYLSAVALLLAALAAVQWWSNGWVAAVAMVARLLGLLLAAWAVTGSTRVTDVMATIARLLTPWRRFVWVRQLPLAVALAVRALPLVATFIGRAREARMARGAPSGLRGLPGLTVSTLVQTIRLSDAMSEALIARGGLQPSEPTTGPSPRS